MVLAAGLGTRMRPLTDSRPKALVEVMGRSLLDHALDRLAAADVNLAVVNLHHFADQIEAHLSSRKQPKVIFSDEREGLLSTGGGVAKALSQLGAAPFFLLNSDSLWIEGATPNLARLGRAFDAGRMDALLLLRPQPQPSAMTEAAIISWMHASALRRRAGDEKAPFIYAGCRDSIADAFRRRARTAPSPSRPCSTARKKRAPFRSSARWHLLARGNAGGGLRRRGSYSPRARLIRGKIGHGRFRSSPLHDPALRAFSADARGGVPRRTACPRLCPAA